MYKMKYNNNNVKKGIKCIFKGFQNVVQESFPS